MELEAEPGGDGAGATDLPILTMRRGDFTITTDPRRLDLDAVHAALDRSYWAAGIPRDVVARSIRGSLCFGLYDGGGRQVGFARLVTDHATFAYLADVYVLEECRGRGLGKWLVEVVLSYPTLAGLRRILLATRDAQTLYTRYGFTALPHPERVLQIHRPDIYRVGGAAAAPVHGAETGDSGSVGAE